MDGGVGGGGGVGLVVGDFGMVGVVGVVEGEERGGVAAMIFMLCNVEMDRLHWERQRL